MDSVENKPFFEMSPLAASHESGGNSLSFNGSKNAGPATSGASAMSTDSLASRAPFGELQHTNFEFSKPTQFGAGDTSSKPATFSSLLSKQADSVRTPDQRPALSEEPVTPGSVVSESKGAPSADAAAAPRAPIVWSDILLWKEPLQSLAIFCAGLLAFGLFTFAAYGAHKMTLVSGLSYLLMADLFANFFRYFVSKPWHDKCLWGGAAQMKHVLTRVNAGILHLAAAHDKYLSAENPMITLKVAGVLWSTAWIGSFLGLWWCALLAYIGAFTLPGVYLASKDSLHAAAKSMRAATIDKADAAGLPRTVRALAVASVVTVLFFVGSWTQSFIGFFVAATYWRTLLVPKEVDLIRSAAEPYTMSVHKASRRIGAAAEDAFLRMSTAKPSTRTKSHFRKSE
ncbi:Reticulon-domain-containing protein [Scenedesmus sp. NREL 46B-D3]|nr:Reticulon-domain-containing protein [Scenedesmus sp. NREL 46B-D3]KAF6256153.1 Reticulon-domain-containing protein [Scenedesmus sp. NREL 46B-D3]